MRKNNGTCQFLKVYNQSRSEILQLHKDGMNII